MFHHTLPAIETCRKKGMFCQNCDLSQIFKLLPSKQVTYPKIALLGVLFATDFTGEWFFSCVSDQMPLHCGNTDKPLTTYCTNRQDLGRPFPHTYIVEKRTC